MQYMQDFSFPAQERMKLRKHIDTLFQNGKAFSIYPFRVIHHKVVTHELALPPIRVGISVPKKKLQKAHQRNLIKRRTKEAWRINKTINFDLLMPSNEQIHCFLVFQSNKILDFQIIQEGIKKIQLQLNKLYQP